MENIFTWIGIFFCISQSAIFSGLNLAFFSLTRLRLEIEASVSNDKRAEKVLMMRKDSNFLLTTILWGNVGINVLLTLLTDSVLMGVSSFLFSTVMITFFGEIIPQAYFSRNALKMASLLTPVMKFYQFILYPVAKPTSLVLNSWLGKEAIQYFSESNLKMFIRKHVEGDESEIDYIEGIGALNFLTLDDLDVVQEGSDINHDSILNIEMKNGKPHFPEYEWKPDDPFIKAVNKSGEKWIIFTDKSDQPVILLDADGFIRSVFNSDVDEDINQFCHVPIIVKNKHDKLGDVIYQLKDDSNRDLDIPIDKDVILLWTKDKKKIITGSDILGRLLKGI
jgi:metal transporter CNNM